MKKNTKKSLFFSITALILCCALLAGTTFAWFTDTVTSGVNTIQAGNLDIEVEYTTDHGTTWTNLEGSKSLFTNNKWEPGHTEYVTLKIQNKGSLALNYKALVTPVSENGGVNVNGQSFKLSDYLVFATTDATTNEATYATRDDARREAGNVTKLTDVNTLTKFSTMDPNDTQYITLVIYMPEDVDNAANHKTGTTAPTINLGIKVVATQLQAENDSFGNDYDKDAVNDPVYVAGAYYNYFEAVNVSVTADGDGNFEVQKTDENSGIIASASGTAAAGAEVNLVVTKTSVPDGNFGITVDEGHELNGYDIKVTGQTENSLVQGKLYVGTGLENFKFYHNGVVMTDGTQGNLANGEYCYNITDGFVYFATETFSPFQATYRAPVAAIGTAVYGTVQDALTAAKSGDTVTLLKDVVVNTVVSADPGGTADTALAIAQKGITLDGNHHSVTIDNGEAKWYLLTINNCTEQVTVKNITLIGSATSKANLNMTGCSNVVLENVAAKGGACSAIVNNSVVTVNGEYTNLETGAWQYAIDIANGGTYNPQTPALTVNAGKLGILLFENAGSGTITGGTIDAVAAAENHTGTISISGGRFGADPSEYVASGYYAQQNDTYWTVEKIFNLGSGTPEDPFIISNTTQFYSIADGSNKGLCFKLANDIAVDSYKRFVDNSPATSNGGSGNAVIPYLTNCTIDGDGHTISVGSNYYMFGMLTNCTIKNVNFNVNGHNLTYMGTDIVFDNVDVSGKVDFAWNDGVYITYIYGGNNTLKDCANYTTMNGNWYSSVFVGYVIDSSYDTVVNFENCDNYGRLTCSYASLFVANPHYAKLTLNISNCHNYGTVHQIYDDEIFNPLTSVTWDGSPTYWKVTINGQSLSTWKDAKWEDFGGNYIRGPKDDALNICMNEDKTLTVTPASNEHADHYVVAFEAYCAITQGGSMKCVISETLETETFTSTIKVCPFVDKTWVEKNPTAVKGEANGFVTYTLGDDTYYLIPVGEEELDMYTTWGKVLDVSSVYVMAYSEDNTLLAVSTLQ